MVWWGCDEAWRALFGPAVEKGIDNVQGLGVSTNGGEVEIGSVAKVPEEYWENNVILVVGGVQLSD